MAVDLTGIAIQVSDSLSCPGDNRMFQAYKCDLSAPGRVSFPFWLRSPVEQNCVIWGVFTMDRDTAVYLAKEQVWAEALALGGAEAQKYVPQDFMSGNWDCSTAQFAMTAWQRVYGGAGGVQIERSPLDALVFASLLTASQKMQTAAQILAQNDATMKALLKGAAAGELVVPPPISNYGSVFVGVNPPATCAPAGTGPGTVPGTQPGTGYLPVVAGEDKKWPTWALPAVIVAGVAAGVGIAYAVTRKKSSPAFATSEGFEARRASEECAECRY